MLTTNIENQNTNIDIKISEYHLIRANIDNVTGYLTNIRKINKITRQLEPLITLNINKIQSTNYFTKYTNITLYLRNI